MANFFLIVDPDPERRSRFVKAVKPRLAIVDGLIEDECSTGDFCAVWAANPEAPISRHAGERSAGILWGEAIREGGPARAEARDLAPLWREADAPPEIVFDGIFAACLYSADRGLIVGADALGVFPVYYYLSETVTLVGSSPELFREHPVFQPDLDPQGIVGVLLTMHSFDGRTLYRNVRRLAPGHVLLARPDAMPREIRQYIPPVSDSYHGLPLFALEGIAERAIEQAVLRHAPAQGRYALMLSGGRDSRLIGGFLAARGVTVDTITVGRPADIDARCARRVSRVLGFSHRTVSESQESYGEFARIRARWEHGLNGFNSIVNWGAVPSLREIAPRVVTGHIIDSAVGGHHIAWACPPSCDRLCFEAFFAQMNRWAVSPHVLRRLLRPDVFGDALDETLARIRAVYESDSDREFQRAWRFDLRHRQRLHVGGTAWGLSFGAWPIWPSVDRGLLECMAGMPCQALSNRTIEDAVIWTRFPELARLPLDRSSCDTMPLRPRLRHLIAHCLYWRVKPIRLLAEAVRRRQGERRFYHRIYNFNGPGWRRVREVAEPCRESALQLFDRRALGEFLPPPEATLSFEDPVADPSGRKTILGLMLWGGDHL